MTDNREEIADLTGYQQRRKRDYLERELGVTITRLKADFSKEIARKRMFIARDQRTRRLALIQTYAR